MPPETTGPGQSSTGPISTPILDSISGPAGLQGKSFRELKALAAEIRAALIESVTRTGGHLGASLGTVELTIALHTVFSSPRDKLVWDVGHQAYTHKMLTGRHEPIRHPPEGRRHVGIPESRRE